MKIAYSPYRSGPSSYQFDSNQPPRPRAPQGRALAALALAGLLGWMGLVGWAHGKTNAAPSQPPAGAAWQGVVTFVVDGDTLRVRPPGGGRPVRVRVEGIDAPEICQPGGAASRDALKRRALGRTVQLHSRAHDDYGRTLARVLLGGDDLGAWMVAQGQAWSYRSGWHPGPYAAQQKRAETAGRGMFAPGQAPALEPRVFRKRHGACAYPSARP